MNNEQTMVVTGSPDKTLRVWNVKNLIQDFVKLHGDSRNFIEKGLR